MKYYANVNKTHVAGLQLSMEVEEQKIRAQYDELKNL